jgi:hypothetical protein
MSLRLEALAIGIVLLAFAFTPPLVAASAAFAAALALLVAWSNES